MAKDYKIKELRKDEGGRGGGFEEPVVCEKELTVVRPSQGRGWARSDHVVFSHKSRVRLLFGLIESSRRLTKRNRWMRVLKRTMSLRAIAASRTRVTPVLPPVVHLNEVEDKLCSLLDEFVQHLKQQDGIQTTCRFAGGWVRDKVWRFSPGIQVTPL